MVISLIFLGLSICFFQNEVKSQELPVHRFLLPGRIDYSDLRNFKKIHEGYEEFVGYNGDTLIYYLFDDDKVTLKSVSWTVKISPKDSASFINYLNSKSIRLLGSDNDLDIFQYESNFLWDYWHHLLFEYHIKKENDTYVLKVHHSFSRYDRIGIQKPESKIDWNLDLDMIED